MSLLEFKNVSFKYITDDYELLENISFEVEKNDFITVIGKSGCGKSTLLRLITCLETDYSGEITLCGNPVKNTHGYAAFMPQKDLLLPWRTIIKNVMLPLEAQKVPKSQRTELAKDALARVGLSGMENKYPSELSGGMRQRVSFARTLLAGGELMLLDEPFSALDSLTRISMQDWLLQQVKQLSKTVMLVTHDIDEAMLLGNKIFLLTGRPVSEVKIIDVSHIKTRKDLYSDEAAELKNKLVSRFLTDDSGKEQS